MEEVGKDLHLLGTVRECVHKGIKMNVYETIGSGWLVGVDGGIMSMESAHLSYLLGSLTRKTGPSKDFPPLSTPTTSSFCDSRLNAKRLLDSNVMFAKGTPSNDVCSPASVTRKDSRTFVLSKIDVRTSDVTS